MTEKKAPAIEDVEDLLDVVREGTHKILFYRESKDHTWMYLKAVDPSKVTPLGIREYARDRWGGGDFKARIRESSGKFGASRSFSIEGDAKRASHDEERRGRRRDRDDEGDDPSSMLRQILVPLAIAAGSALVKKMMDDPKTDPVMMKLLENSLKSSGGSMDPLALQRSLLEAEERGERRGKLFGEMKAQLEHEDGAESPKSQSAVVTAVREAAGAVTNIIDYAKKKDATVPSGAPVRVVNRPPTNGREHAAASGAPVSPAPSSASVPAYLQPIVDGKERLLWAIDAHIPADSIVNAIVNAATDEQLAQLFASHDAATFREELLAALPELGADHRAEAVEQLLEEIATAVQELRADPDATAEPEPPKKKSGGKKDA